MQIQPTYSYVEPTEMRAQHHTLKIYTEKEEKNKSSTQDILVNPENSTSLQQHFQEMSHLLQWNDVNYHLPRPRQAPEQEIRISFKVQTWKQIPPPLLRLED